MIRVEMMVMEEKDECHTRGKDWAVEGNPNKFRSTDRKEYESKEKGMDYKTGLTERMPL